MPLVFIVYYYVTEVFQRTQDFQKRNLDNKDSFQHPDGRLFEIDLSKWTDGDRAYFTYYACKHAKVRYKESYRVWVLEREYKEIKEFDFHCDVMDSFISNLIRVRYRGPMSYQKEPIQSRFYNTNPALVQEVGHGRLNLTDEELQEVRFYRQSDYK